MRVEPYRPSNGSEADCFQAKWCMRCAKDDVMNGSREWDDTDDSGLCEILAKALAFGRNDPNYPKAWVIKDGVPTCTEFVEFGTAPPRITELERAAQMSLLP